mgnify:FL=1
MPLELFSPVGATATLSATNTTGNVALTSIGTNVNRSVRVYNAGTATVFLTFGNDSTITATTAGMPLPSGGIEVFQLGPNITYAAGITASGTATVYFTSGMGG